MLVKDRKEKLIHYIKSYCGSDPNGKNLHQVLYDLDISDKMINDCVKWSKSKGDDNAVRIGRFLLNFNKKERKEIIIESGVSWMGDRWYHDGENHVFHT